MTQHSTPEITRTGVHENGPVVVGVDGSEASLEALEWAVKEARQKNLDLVAVTTWDWPNSYGYPVPWPEGVDFEKDARQILEESVEKVCGMDDKASVTQVVLQGHAALVLLEQSKTASVIVVGSRGHGEFSGMLIGSVSEYLATHAHCPVVIIRHG